MKGNRYNRSFGENKFATELLDMLGLKRAAFGRYRDTFIDRQDGEFFILVYTRIGGGSKPYFKEHMAKVGRHPFLLNTWDEEAGDSYHTLKFKLPPGNQARATKIFYVQGPVQTVFEKFAELGEEMKKLTPEEFRNDPRFEEDIKLLDTFNGGGGIIRTYDDDMPEGLQV